MLFEYMIVLEYAGPLSDLYGTAWFDWGSSGEIVVDIMDDVFEWSAVVDEWGLEVGEVGGFVFFDDGE